MDDGGEEEDSNEGSKVSQGDPLFAGSDVTATGRMPRHIGQIVLRLLGQTAAGRGPFSRFLRDLRGALERTVDAVSVSVAAVSVRVTRQGSDLIGGGVGGPIRADLRLRAEPLRKALSEALATLEQNLREEAGPDLE